MVVWLAQLGAAARRVPMASSVALADDLEPMTAEASIATSHSAMAATTTGARR